MSVFGRIANLWKGFINLWISDVEKDHPETANSWPSMVRFDADLDVNGWWFGGGVRF